MRVPKMPIIVFALAVGTGLFQAAWAQEPGSETYLSPAQVVPYGTAARAKEHRVSGTATQETYSLILYDGDEVMTALTDFAKRHHVTAAHFTAIGAVHDAKVGWLDLGRKQYKVINVDGQVEVLSLVGDIGDVNGSPAVHAHVVLGLPSGDVKGGHLMHAVVSPTLEIFVTTGKAVLQKKADPDTGMTIFQ